MMVRPDVVRHNYYSTFSTFTPRYIQPVVLSSFSVSEKLLVLNTVRYSCSNLIKL